MLTDAQQQFCKAFASSLKQKLFYARHLPLALICGLRLIHLDEQQCKVSAPFNWRTKNPFRSMYFAVQCMAAELSTGAFALLALKQRDASIALIITGMQSQFSKKVQSAVTFTCHDYAKFADAVQKLNHSGDSTEVTATTIGHNAQGDEVARFTFTWSFKMR